MNNLAMNVCSFLLGSIVIEIELKQITQMDRTISPLKQSGRCVGE